MRVHQIRTESATFDLVESGDMPEIFADGVSRMIMGAGITKLVFHTVTDPSHPENQIEQRKAVTRITIPTAVLLEICKNVLHSAQSSMQLLSENGKQLDDQIKKIMNGVNISDPE
jgi:hypothetical protein